MNTTAKRFILAGVGALLAVLAVLWLAPAAGHRYVAESWMLATPYTNTLSTRAFETRIIKPLPGVLRLKMIPARFAGPGSSTALSTNGMVICIVAVGPTGPDAQQAANDDAQKLCQMVHEYGLVGSLIRRADNSRSYSWFHDGFQPAIARAFAP